MKGVLRRKAHRVRDRRHARPRFHCEVCESRIRHYSSFVMRWNAETDQIYTPSGLLINLRYK